MFGIQKDLCRRGSELFVEPAQDQGLIVEVRRGNDEALAPCTAQRLDEGLEQGRAPSDTPHQIPGLVEVTRPLSGRWVERLRHLALQAVVDRQPLYKVVKIRLESRYLSGTVLRVEVHPDLAVLAPARERQIPTPDKKPSTASTGKEDGLGMKAEPSRHRHWNHAIPFPEVREQGCLKRERLGRATSVGKDRQRRRAAASQRVEHQVLDEHEIDVLRQHNGVRDLGLVSYQL